MALLGAHVSTAGGIYKAFARGSDIGCQSMQIFVKSPNQWRAKPPDPADVSKFQAERQSIPQPVVAHAAYLINLASPKEDLLEKSRAALLDELQRCTAFGVDGLVFHPGAHTGSGEDAGIEQIARSLDWILAEDPGITTKVLLENTAGQGSTLGTSFKQLRRIIDLVDQDHKVGVCVDSCHAFAAGYDLSTADGYEATFAEFADVVGMDRLACIHLNDSKHPLGSNKDRHDNIGSGLIGMEFFARIVNDPMFTDLALVLETPLGDDDLGHKRDLEILRGLVNA